MTHLLMIFTLQLLMVNLRHIRYAFKNVMMPMYFKENEYNEIINIIKQKYTVREHLIIHLMYNFGLRIGEVLGLTSEDLHVSD